MTDLEIRVLAEQALAAIAKTPKGMVYASTKGRVAGVKRPNGVLWLFRRVGEHVRLEVVSEGKCAADDDSRFPLPPDLERRARAMLDEL